MSGHNYTPPPESLVGALHGRVHVEGTNARGVRAAGTRRKKMERTNVEVLDGGLILVDPPEDNMRVLEPVGLGCWQGGGFVRLYEKCDGAVVDLYGWTLREFAVVWAEALRKWRNPGFEVVMTDPRERVPTVARDMSLAEIHKRSCINCAHYILDADRCGPWPELTDDPEIISCTDWEAKEDNDV